MQAQGDRPSSGSPPVPREGEIIAGKYRVERVLGQGGMGVVLAARHIELRQPVAVKFLLPQALEQPNASVRFLREAQAAAAIESEHVARVLDVGTLETSAPYMVMEYLTGHNLKDVLQSRGHLPVEEAVNYVLQICRALSVAHSLGIVHRDLKPANLFLAQRADGSQVVKVLDFGLSKVTAAADGAPLEQGITATSIVIGTPHYMPPEQLRSLKHVDARADVWALGVILYEFLTGRRPFDGASLPDIFAMIIAGAPPPIRLIRPDVTSELEQIVLRCLEKDPICRIQTVTDLSASLEPFGAQPARASLQGIEKSPAEAPSQRSSSTNAPPKAVSSTTMALTTSMINVLPTPLGMKRLMLVTVGMGALAAAVIAAMGFTTFQSADTLVNPMGLALLQAAVKATPSTAPPHAGRDAIRDETSKASPALLETSPTTHAEVKPGAESASRSPSDGAQKSTGNSSSKAPSVGGTTKKASSPAAQGDVRDRWE